MVVSTGIRIEDPGGIAFQSELTTSRLLALRVRVPPLHNLLASKSLDWIFIG